MSRRACTAGEWGSGTIFGTMTLTNRKGLVKILEFGSPEAHDTVRGMSGETSVCVPGAGEAVEFHSGRVLEAWMASGSAHENLPGVSGPSECNSCARSVESNVCSRSVHEYSKYEFRWRQP